MSSVAANENKSKAKIFDTVLSSPGMTDKCKINLMLSRQNIIFISRLIEGGVSSDQNGLADEIIAALPKESLNELKAVQEEILSKGNLTEFYERLKLL